MILVALSELVGDVHGAWLVAKADRLRTVSDPTTDPETLHSFASDMDIDVRSCVAAHPATNPETLAAMFGDRPVHACLAANPATPPHVLRLLHEPPAMPLVHEALAANPSTPTSLLDEYATGAWFGDIRLSAWKNPALPAVTIRERVEDWYDIDAALACLSNTSCPPDVIEANAVAEYDRRRAAAAANPSTPPELLANLAGDLSLVVREQAAKNPSLTSDTLMRLAADDALDIVVATAQNPQASPSVLRDCLRNTQGTQPWAERAAYAVARSPAVDGTLLTALLRMSPNSELELLVAESPHCPVEFLRHCAQQDHPALRRRAAAHSNTDPATLRLLADDPDPDVATAVAENPSTGLDVLDRLVAHSQHAPRIRLAVLSNPQVRPAEITATTPSGLALS